MFLYGLEFCLQRCSCKTADLLISKPWPGIIPESFSNVIAWFPVLFLSLLC